MGILSCCSMRDGNSGGCNQRQVDAYVTAWLKPPPIKDIKSVGILSVMEFDPGSTCAITPRSNTAVGTCDTLSRHGVSSSKKLINAVLQMLLRCGSLFNCAWRLLLTNHSEYRLDEKCGTATPSLELNWKKFLLNQNRWLQRHSICKISYVSSICELFKHIELEPDGFFDFQRYCLSHVKLCGRGWRNDCDNSALGRIKDWWYRMSTDKPRVLQVA